MCLSVPKAANPHSNNRTTIPHRRHRQRDNRDPPTPRGHSPQCGVFLHRPPIRYPSAQAPAVSRETFGFLDCRVWSRGLSFLSVFRRGVAVRVGWDCVLGRPAAYPAPIAGHVVGDTVPVCRGPVPISILSAPSAVTCIGGVLRVVGTVWVDNRDTSQTPVALSRCRVCRV